MISWDIENRIWKLSNLQGFCYYVFSFPRWKFYRPRNWKHLYEEQCHFLFKFWRDQTTLDIIEALCEILNSLKGRKNVMPDTSFHPKSVVRSQNGAKIFLKSQLINSCKNNLRVMLSFAVFTEIFLLTTIWRLDYQNEMIEV